MKTANVKVRVKNVRRGVTMFTAHPFYGINQYVAEGKPFMVDGIGLFVNVRVKSLLGNGDYITKRSLNDAGITPGDSRNGRRTFFKLKHAEAWMKKWATQKAFLQRHADHVEWCQMLDHWRF